tara:strand:+ start:81 stop:809 length:729 start_codon:yes stop_codon:yes gene_type:complete
MNKEVSIILPIYNEKESLPIMVRLLESSMKIKKEIIIVYDSENDNALTVAKELKNEYQNIKLVHNKVAKGVKYAVDVGIANAKYEVVIIFAVDEIFPIISIERMLEHLLKNNLDFISGTRYSKGGSRLGGSLLGSVFSRVANSSFKFLTNIPFSDCTTGIKMMKKNVWNAIELEAKPIGWAFSFEISIKVYLKKYKIDEYPLKSVDRLFGGSSTFKFGPWLKEYLKWYIYGLKTLRFNSNSK